MQLTNSACTLKRASNNRTNEHMRVRAIVKNAMRINNVTYKRLYTDMLVPNIFGNAIRFFEANGKHNNSVQNAIESANSELKKANYAFYVKQLSNCLQVSIIK